MYKTFIIRGVLSLFILMTTISFSIAQDNSDLNTAWSVNVNIGPSLLWSDMSDKSDPFSKMFSDQSKFSYGIIGRKGLNDVFGVNIQAIVGDMKGIRNEWSDGTPTGGFTSEVFFTEVNANLDMDILNLFSPKDMRLVNPYVKAGIGMTYYKTNVTYKGTDYNGTEKSTMIIPFGGGIRFDVSRRIGITLETTFEYAFTDWLDGFHTVNSEANDWYSYTSVGLTYRFVPKEAKDESSYNEDEFENGEENEAASDSSATGAAGAAGAAAIVKTSAPFYIAADIPSEVFQGDTFLVTLKVTPGDNTNGHLKVQQTLPAGYTAEAKDTHGGRFEFASQTVNINWNSVPVDSQFTVTYNVYTTKAEIGASTIPGIAMYYQDSTDKSKNFSNNINIKSFATKNQMLVVSAKSLLVYRVQVTAIYGGKTSAKDIQRRYNINKDVHVDTEGGYTKYTVGGFATYEEAKKYRDNLRSNGLPGAFVVGYYDDTRINNIKQAIEIEKSDKEIMVIAPASTQQKSDVYSIQIASSAVNKSPYQMQSKYKIKDTINKTYSGGLYKYTIGSYTDYSEAKAKLKEIKQRVPDAFITVSTTR
jgi:hypothetical protein